ncbi:10011_t:CDS:2, partial [Acaulospora morrowiae]
MTASWESVSSQQIDIGITDEQREKLKKRWNENSFLHKLKQGPFASTLYA